MTHPDVVKKWDIFISYKSKYRAWVDLMYQGFVDCGYHVFQDRHAMKFGDPLAERLDEGIRLSRVGLILGTEDATQSRWVKREYDAMLEKEGKDKHFRLIALWFEKAPNLPFVENSIAAQFGTSLPEYREALHRLFATLGAIFPQKTKPTDARLNRLAEQLFTTMQSLQQKTDDPKTGAESFQNETTQHLPFTNREKELETLLQTKSPFHLISAPAEYGKTRLIQHVQKRYQAQGWLCLSVSLSDMDVSLEAVINKYLKQLPVTADIINYPLEKRLAHALMQHCPNQSHEGLLLLLDFEPGADTGLAGPFLALQAQHTLPMLRRLQCFENGDMRFRCMVAGRYLKIDPQYYSGRLSAPWRTHSLSEFTFPVLQRTLKKVLPKHFNRSNIAAELLYHTGGHPQCVSKVVHSLQSGAMSITQHARICVRHVAGYIKPQSLERNNRLISLLIGPLSVYRYFDEQILEVLIRHEGLDVGIYEPANIGGELQAAGLYTRPVRSQLWSDGLIRKTQAIAYRNEQPQAFRVLCLQASELYLYYLRERQYGAEYMCRWLIEYWFQHLQTMPVNDDRLQLDDHILLVGLTLYLNESPFQSERTTQEGIENSSDKTQDKQTKLQNLQDALEADAEFCFYVNYQPQTRTYDKKRFRSLWETIQRLSAIVTT